MIKLTTNLSDPLLELIHDGLAPIDAVEVGPWFSVPQICNYRQMLPGYLFYFHGGDLIERVGLIPGATSKIAAYLNCTSSPWVSMHITMWLPGMVGLMLRRGWRVPLPNPEQATRWFIRRVKRYVQSAPTPVLLENVTPLPFDGYDFEVRPERIAQVLEQTRCGFVLDIGHAQVSAATLGIGVCDYLGDLPLDRVVQIHISGPRMREGHLVDAHEPLQETDYALLNYVLERTQPQVVTLEYIRERQALQEQLSRLRGIVDSFNASF